jgi:putative phosphoesterase
VTEEPLRIDLEREVTIGVVGDTHIPDRVGDLHPDLIPGLKNHHVDLVLHTGDVCMTQVLETFASVAPVYTVRGNRDFFMSASILMQQTFVINQTRILLTHGHMNMWHYWRDKFEYFTRGYQPQRYVHRLRNLDKDARVIIFGHSHRSENSVHEGILFFNPGSSCSGDLFSTSISYGILSIQPDGVVNGKILPLEGYKIRSGKWSAA